MKQEGRRGENRRKTQKREGGSRGRRRERRKGVLFIHILSSFVSYITLVVSFSLSSAHLSNVLLYWVNLPSS